MGFLSGFMDGIRDNKENKKIIEMYHESREFDNDYRKKAFDNTESNNGWYTCSKCGKKFRKKDMDVDHIVPQSRNGSNSRYNLQVLCAHCNRSKGADMSDTWEDLRRREKELRRQDKEDLEYLNSVSKQLRNKSKKGR